VIERAAELGITNFAVHKSIPLGPTTTDPYRMDDVVVPAAKFPDLKFQIVHAGIAFTEETAMLLHRFRNVYANLEGTSGYILRKPRVFYEAIGMMAEWGSYEQIIWASGCNLSHPKPLLEHVLEGSMPDDLVEGRGCPPLDDRAKALMLGGNLLRLHGLPTPSSRDSKTLHEECEKPIRSRGRASGSARALGMTLREDTVLRLLDQVQDPCSVRMGKPLGLVGMGLVESVTIAIGRSASAWC
jgi:hypothetical protein